MRPLNFRAALVSVTLFAAIPLPISAQSSSVPAAISAELDSDILPDDSSILVLPTQIVNAGPSSWSRGLQAYHAGNYAEAENEFRSSLNFYADTVSGTRFGGAEGIQELIRAGTFSQTGSRINTNRRRSRGVSTAERSLARSSYAVGAALIKQERYSDAKRYFSRAIGYDRYLHDARLRLGLIALAEDNLRGAERRLRQLNRFCRSLDCTESNLGHDINTLTDAIAVYTAHTSDS